MNEKDRGTLRDKHAAALRDYLENGEEGALHEAYEVGRLAIGEGLGLLDLIALHGESHHKVLRERNETKSQVAEADAAGRFLSECLSPFEMTHRGFQEAVAVLRRLNEMLEEEAKRIAHALHDEAGQLLVSVHLAVQEVATELPPRYREHFKRIRAPLDEMEKHLRRLSHELRPTVLDDLGLVPALEFLVQGMMARSGMSITVEGPKAPRLPVPIEVALYRVVQEAARNATKHAAAKRIDVRILPEAKQVRCTIKDNGKGFDVVAALGQKGGRGLGLIGMRERINALGGQLSIESTPRRGTEVRITIPLGDNDGHTGPSRG